MFLGVKFNCAIRFTIPSLIPLPSQMKWLASVSCKIFKVPISWLLTVSDSFRFSSKTKPAGRLLVSRSIGSIWGTPSKTAANDFLSRTISALPLRVKGLSAFSSADSMALICRWISVFRSVTRSSDLLVSFSNDDSIFCFFASITATRLSTSLWTSLFTSSPCCISLANSSSSWLTVFIFACKMRLCFSTNDFISLFCISASSLINFILWPPWSNVTQIWQTGISQVLQKYFSSSLLWSSLEQKSGRFITSS